MENETQLIEKILGEPMKKIMIEQTDFDRAYCNSKKPESPEDIKRIQQAAKRHWGLKITPEQAYDVWHYYSNDYAAEWLTIGDDGEIIDALFSFTHYYLNVQREKTRGG